MKVKERLRTIVRKDMASFKVTRTYTIDSLEINYVNDNVVFVDIEIRRFDKYQYTISGVFNFSSFITLNGVPKNYNLSLNIEPFTSNIIFVCFDTQDVLVVLTPQRQI